MALSLSKGLFVAQVKIFSMLYPCSRFADTKYSECQMHVWVAETTWGVTPSWAPPSSRSASGGSSVLCRMQAHRGSTAAFWNVELRNFILYIKIATIVARWRGCCVQARISLVVFNAFLIVSFYTMKAEAVPAGDIEEVNNNIDAMPGVLSRSHYLNPGPCLLLIIKFDTWKQFKHTQHEILSTRDFLRAAISCIPNCCRVMLSALLTPQHPCGTQCAYKAGVLQCCRQEREDSPKDLSRLPSGSDKVMSELRYEPLCRRKNIMICKQCRAHIPEEPALHEWRWPYEIWCFDDGQFQNVVIFLSEFALQIHIHDVSSRSADADSSSGFQGVPCLLVFCHWGTCVCCHKTWRHWLKACCAPWPPSPFTMFTLMRIYLQGDGGYKNWGYRGDVRLKRIINDCYVANFWESLYLPRLSVRMCTMPWVGFCLKHETFQTSIA